MSKEIIIGRSGTQPFKIPEEYTCVHGEHARITISDNGQWFIEDLKGEKGQGTYVKDENGYFRRVYKKQILETDIIRLGRQGYGCFTFMAHRVTAVPGDYSFEFRQMRRWLRELKDREEEQEKKNFRNGWIGRCSGIVAVLVCLVVGSALDMDSEMQLNLNRVLVPLAPIAVGLAFGNDMNRLRAVRLLRTRKIVCPHCGRPLSDFDVENQQCSSCKAH